jgi:hypothetical protein
MNDLRQQIAARLRQIAERTLAAQHPRINARGAILEHYEALADECLRQMEWARREAVAQAEKVFDFHTQEAIGQWDREAYGAGARTALSVIKRDVRRNWNGEMTVAPNDWEPEPTDAE